YAWRRTPGSRRRTGTTTHRSIRARTPRNGSSCGTNPHLRRGRSLDEPSQNERGNERPALALLAPPGVLIRLHFCGVVAVRTVRIAADCRTHAVNDRRSKQRVRALKPLDLAEPAQFRSA